MLRNLPVTDVILFGGTRVALGIGIGLLLSGRLNRDQRHGAGLALTVVGALTTIPMVIAFRRRLGGDIHEEPLPFRQTA
jgi:hypothetical protein